MNKKRLAYPNHELRAQTDSAPGDSRKLAQARGQFSSDHHEQLNETNTRLMRQMPPRWLFRKNQSITLHSVKTNGIATAKKN